MTEIKLKRVYEDYDEKDGYRVLVDRLWPRGMKKEHLHYDLWEKDITPSTPLREWLHEDPEKNWELFVSKYKKELEENPDMDDFMKELKKHAVVTFLYATKDEHHNHAVVLKEFIESKLKK